MNEYLETLRIRASEGESQASIDLSSTVKYISEVRASTQRAASDMRAKGEDVNYLNNEVGGISVGDRLHPPIDS